MREGSKVNQEYICARVLCFQFKNCVVVVGFLLIISHTFTFFVSVIETHSSY